MPKRLKPITIFTDGSCFGNGKTNAIGGIGIHFPDGELDDISEVYPNGTCSNNKAELYAILRTLKYVDENLGLDNYKVTIKSDSDYGINCVTNWISGWIANGWKTKAGKPVSNREYIEPIYKYYRKYNITFVHVDAHTKKTDPDSIANDIADKLAKKASNKARGIETEISTDSDEELTERPHIRKPVRRSGSKTVRKSSNSTSRRITNTKSSKQSIPQSDDFVIELIGIK